MSSQLKSLLIVALLAAPLAGRGLFAVTPGDVALLALSVFELDSRPSTALQGVSAVLAWGGILIFVAGVLAWIIQVGVRSARDN